MTRTIIISIMLLLFANRIQGRGVSDTLRTEHISPTGIVGTYGDNRVYFTFKANKKCKLIYIAPRPLVYRGEWEIRNDTLICTFNRTNQGKNVQLKNNPMIYKFIVYRDKLYYISEENGQTSLILVPKTK